MLQRWTLAHDDFKLAPHCHMHVLAMKNKYILLIPVDRVYLATDTIIYARIDSCLMGPIVCVVDALLVKI